MSSTPMLQPLIYYWCMAAAQAGRFNNFPNPSVRGQFCTACFSKLGVTPVKFREEGAWGGANCLSQFYEFGVNL